MSGPDRDRAHQRNPRPDAEVDTPSRTGAETIELTAKPTSDKALNEITAILGGQGSMRHLPELFSVLEDKQRAAFLEHRMSDLAKAPQGS